MARDKDVMNICLKKVIDKKTKNGLVESVETNVSKKSSFFQKRVIGEHV